MKISIEKQIRSNRKYKSENEQKVWNDMTNKNKFMDYGIFPIALFLFPLLQCNIGVDVTDTGYSLGSFLYGGEQMGEAWVKFATYLATVVGSFLAKLPYGSTMLGMNLYTGMFVSMTAVAAYFFLNRKLPSWMVFLGEFLAISLCWCPTVILYNYLTYFFFTLMIICLYLGIENKYEKKNEKKNRWLFWAAGVILGLDVMTRFPNITHSALILSLWYAAWLHKDKWKGVVTDTLCCLFGFILGFGGVLLSITVTYGAGSYFQMISSLLGGGGGVEGHSLGDMLWSIMDAYLVGCKWLLFAVLVVLGGFILFSLWKGRFLWVKRAAYIGVILVLFRFYYGRGMFNFKYYGYESMFQWAVLFLIIAMICCVLRITGKDTKQSDKILASMILLLILVTPLGSDNYLYPVINNLFLAAPMVLYWVLQYIVQGKSDPEKDEESGKFRNNGDGGKFLWSSFPIKAMLAMILLMLFIQSTCFGMTFVFRDGMSGEKRDTKITDNEVLKGMYTNQENAAALEELTVYCKENGITAGNGQHVLLYGDVPALSCFLELPSAISTTWADLDSYTVKTMESDMNLLRADQTMRDHVVIITSIGFGAWLEEDLEAMNMFGVDAGKYDKDPKASLIRQYMRDMDFQEMYFNGKYVLFQ